MLSRKRTYLTSSTALIKRNTNQLITNCRRTIAFEPITTWYGAHWATIVVYQWFTLMAIFVSEYFKPSIVTHKVPLLHHLYERRNEMKMLRHMDHIVTDWDTNVEASAYDDVISRTQNPL